MKFNQAPEGVSILTYNKASVPLPRAEEVDTLVPSKKMDELTNGDPDPFYKVEAIGFPAKGTGGVYDESFFKSYLNVTKDRPIPGSKRGHEFTSRPSSDFYTVGGRMDKNADGKTGTVYLKIYIPKQGDTTDNAGFIRDARAGIVNFSLVTAPDYKVVTEPDENGNRVQVTHFVASKGYERNDAVEYGAGAMAQTVNSAQTAFDIDAARALIEEGKFDIETKIEGSPLQNGKVYRTALRRLQSSRAYDNDATELAELIRMIDRSKNGRKSMDKDEALKLLSNCLKNGSDNIQDVANALGFGDKLRNESDVKNAETVKALNAKLGDKPLETIDAMLAENAKTADDRVKNAVIEAFGAAEIETVPGKKVENAMHVLALRLCEGKSGDELKNAIEEAKKDPVMKALAAQNADGNSGVNRLVNGGAQSSGSISVDGIVTHKIGGK